MTDEKCRFVLDLYALALNEMRPHHPDAADHVATMLPKMRAMLVVIEGLGLEALAESYANDADAVDALMTTRGEKREKFMRWLGFVQGVFYVTGVYTIEQMKAHNKPETPDAARPR